MPLFPPGWLTSHARYLTGVIAHLTRGPLVTALLERAGGHSNTPWRGEQLPADDMELLTLVLYWFWEYVEKRISPGELLDVLSHLLANRITEV